MPRKKKGADGLYRMSFSYEGKQYSVRSKDPGQLSAKMAAKIKELASGVKIINEKTLVKDWGKEWIETYKNGISPGARARLNGMLQHYISPVIGYMSIKSVRPIHCQHVLNDMEGLAKDTISKCRNLLFNIFDAAVENGLCASNPAKHLTIPQVKTEKTHRSLSDRERIVLLETAKTHPAGLWVQLLLYTGLRPGESVVLTGADLHGGYIRVNKALDRSGGVKEPKSKAGIRKIPIIPALQKLLPALPMHELLFKNSRGGLPNSRWIARQWHSFLAAMEQTELDMIEAGYFPALKESLPPLEPYDLRHTYCSDLERAGVPINVASQLMGHADIKITARIYTHTSKDVFEDAAAKLAAFTDIITDVTNQPETALNGSKTG